MLETAVGLLGAATVSNPPHCWRRAQPAPMSARADYAKSLIMESCRPELASISDVAKLSIRAMMGIHLRQSDGRLRGEADA
jgi:hypothetical protein